CATLKIW
nr:immunoglobulin heavy chain junction region [Macaca mulatta]MOV55465.1 immunoglobulin heavy chain junction region [Macaca mulatta]MOV55843.1 immunoglobulin heavy chain junction region [Macaca mulatta]MOV55893.1 immunoglobulin heavy chain junction region [Macaca mulatta]MOV55995.1 immunoglobulin heavy chain junction region [Macaca mulatta]